MTHTTEHAAVRTLIEGKVAKVLNGRELVINRGSDQGVANGTKFRVLDSGEPILDPDTDKKLGSIDREKIRVKVVYTQPTLAVAQTYQTYGTSSPLLLAELLGQRLQGTKVRTLRAPGRDFTRIDQDESIVDVGDRVVEVDDEG